MNRSYVGVVTSQGLQALYPEDGYVSRFLIRRVYRKLPYTGICCWAVLPEEAANLVQHQLTVAENLMALATLQSQALHSGMILPSQYLPAEECCSQL